MSGTSPTYVVTDIEADGPDPSANSMLSFASVAVDGSGAVVAEFEAVLAPRLDRKPDPDTLAWWPHGDWLKSDFPPDWLGHVEHTHCAIGDARRCANILSRLLRTAGTQSRKPEEFRRIA